MVVEIVEQLEQEGHCPAAHYAFDHGVLTVALARVTCAHRPTRGARVGVRATSGGGASGNGLLRSPRRAGERPAELPAVSGALPPRRDEDVLGLYKDRALTS